MTTLSLPCRHCEETISGQNEEELVAHVQSHLHTHAGDLGIDHPVTREHVLARLHHHGPRAHGSAGRAYPGATPPRRPEDLYTTQPPWDIDRPQPAFLTLAEAGTVQGRILDIGCGTGEHALMAARLGLDATGIDLATNALQSAEDKARDRGLTAVLGRRVIRQGKGHRS